MEGIAKYNQEALHLLGGIEGLRALSNCFYDIMAEIPEARRIRAMHPKDLGQTRENLTLFLSGWLGGPPLYLKKHGSANLTDIHAHLDIDETDRDMWISCMKQALNKQEVEEGLKTYLIERLQIPAEKIRATCQERRQGLPRFIPTPKK